MSSQPGARLVSTSSSAAMRRCSAFLRSMAAPSGDGLLEDAIALECAPLLRGESEELAEDVVVIRAQRRARPLLRARCRRERERRGLSVNLTTPRGVAPGAPPTEPER